jgi:hypothetical protein
MCHERSFDAFSHAPIESVNDLVEPLLTDLQGLNDLIDGIQLVDNAHLITGIFAYRIEEKEVIKYRRDMKS